MPNLASDGVYTAHSVTGAPVSSYLPFPSLQIALRSVSVALSLESPPPDVIRRPALRCSDFPHDEYVTRPYNQLLQKKPTGRSLFILDEPTTGLHTHDIKKLLAILQRIVDNGDTVLVIEHNLDVIKVADYIIDLGPEGGDNGGTIVAKGTPEEIVKVKESYTGEFLKPLLGKN